MEITEEKVQIDKELTSSQKNNLAKTLKETFSRLDEDRQSQIDDAKEIMNEVYLNQPKRFLDEDNNWKADVNLNKLYSVKKAKKAALWREMWSNAQQMFDVKGTNDKTQKNAKVQKAAIVDSLERMNIGKAYDNATDNLYDIGEMIFITDWEERIKVVKRQKKEKGFVLQELSRIFTKSAGNKMEEIKLPYYQNARVRSLSPFMFVFDHSAFEFGNQKSWDSCLKISKRFETLENIKANKIYTLTKEQEEDLKTQNNKTAEENKELHDLIDESTYGGKFEVLFCHGDIKAGNKVYKNYIAEVLAGKYLIRFEENPLYINPFIFCALEFNPVTKRGISPLKAVLKLSKEQEKIVNTSIDMQQLSLNPPSWINSDLIDKSKSVIKIRPGHLEKLKDGYSGSLPVSMTLGYNNNLDGLSLALDNVISDVSSVNANMYGNITKGKRTATELSMADRGASATVSKELDTINQDLTIPMIKNVAELLAMFKDGDDFIFTEEKGQNLELRITNEIRQAQYNYVYEDRNAINDRKSKFQELYQIFQSAAQDPEIRKMISWRDVIESAVEMVGFDNTDKFFIPDTPLSSLFEQLKQLPEENQNQIINLITQFLQGSFMTGGNIAN